MLLRPLEWPRRWSQSQLSRRGPVDQPTKATLLRLSVDAAVKQNEHVPCRSKFTQQTVTHLSFCSRPGDTRSDPQDERRAALVGTRRRLDSSDVTVYHDIGHWPREGHRFTPRSAPSIYLGFQGGDERNSTKWRYNGSFSQWLRLDLLFRLDPSAPVLSVPRTHASTNIGHSPCICGCYASVSLFFSSGIPSTNL